MISKSSRLLSILEWTPKPKEVWTSVLDDVSSLKYELPDSITNKLQKGFLSSLNASFYADVLHNSDDNKIIIISPKFNKVFGFILNTKNIETDKTLAKWDMKCKYSVTDDVTTVVNKVKNEL